MILSVSRRTDIPHWYAGWFMNRLKAGYVLARNPVNQALLYKVPITPDVVDGIVFWTKDPKNILPYLDTLDHMGYVYYFQFTLTPYGRDLEPGLRDKTGIEDTFIELSKRLGRARVVWRYDPIILNGVLDIPYHTAQFERLCGRLAPYTDTVTVSFVDLYKKLKTPLIREMTDGEIASLSRFIGKTAGEHGLSAVACCEKADLSEYGIGRSACVDRARFERLCGSPLDLKPDGNQRPGCRCCESVDIGAYDTCPSGCVYCYANAGTGKALRRYQSHDTGGELLTGTVTEKDKITDRVVRSNKQGQLRLF